MIRKYGSWVLFELKSRGVEEPLYAYEQFRIAWDSEYRPQSQCEAVMLQR